MPRDGNYIFNMNLYYFELKDLQKIFKNTEINDKITKLSKWLL